MDHRSRAPRRSMHSLLSLLQCKIVSKHARSVEPRAGRFSDRLGSPISKSTNPNVCDGQIPYKAHALT